MDDNKELDELAEKIVAGFPPLSDEHVRELGRILSPALRYEPVPEPHDD